MTHAEVTAALEFLHPGAAWGYDGDGSTLGPMVDKQTGQLVSRGLEWHDAAPVPTLDELAAALPTADVTEAAAEIPAGVVGWTCKQLAGLVCQHPACRPIQPTPVVTSLP